MTKRNEFQERMNPIVVFSIVILAMTLGAVAYMTLKIERELSELEERIEILENAKQRSLQD